MMLGMSIETFTQVHTVISVLGIISGLVVIVGLLRSQVLEWWTEVFLASNIFTSVTGFMFPFGKVLPPHIVGGIALLALLAAVVALYRYRLAGTWRAVYVAGTLVAVYLNCFVGFVQSFQKIAWMSKLAPTQSEPPFVVAQIALLALFLWLGYRARTQFRPALRPA